MQGPPADPSWRPSRPELIATAAVAGLAVLGAAVAPVGRALGALGFLALEVVSMVLDRPTSLVVAGYVACVVAAAVIDRVQPTRGPLRGVGWGVALLALLGVGYLGVFAWMLRPTTLLACAAVAAAGWVGARTAGWSPAAPQSMAPVLTVFVGIHVLVEGTAGHILTPALHGVNAGLARLSAASPLGYDAALGGALGALALLCAPRARRAVLSGVALACAVLGAALPGATVWVALLGASALVGAGTAARGDRLVTWLHPDPLRAIRAVAPLGMVALVVVGAHYGAAVWRCDGLQADGGALRRLSPLDGTFDLEPTRDGAFLVVSRREPQEVVVLDRASGAVTGRLSTRRDTDTAFDHTEPETLVATDGSRVLLLLASSDSEEGNQLVRFDASTARIDGRLDGLGEGVSDLRRDARGGIWLSTEFRGRIAGIDPDTLALTSDREVRGAETNAIAVDVDGGRAWSTGLWGDDLLRTIELATGRELAAAPLGTRQWDLAWDAVSDRVYVPRLVPGVVEVRDADTLRDLGRWDAGFGVRPIEVSDDGRFVVVGNLYTGELLGWDTTTGERTLRARIGGHIKGLRIDGDQVLAGSNCGVFSVTPQGAR
jgi:hypothetical protein